MNVMLTAVVLFVAAFGILMFVIGEALSEAEAERTDLARDASRCGLHGRG
jgi:hypothetical protein